MGVTDGGTLNDIPVDMALKIVRTARSGCTRVKVGRLATFFRNGYHCEKRMLVIVVYYPHSKEYGPWPWSEYKGRNEHFCLVCGLHEPTPGCVGY